MSLLRALLATLALTCAAALPDLAVAQAYPSRPVRVIVPLSAGSAFDLLARAMGEAFKTRTQQSFIVENRPGGNMAIAANACKAAPPDGYTICLLTQNAITLNPLLYARLSYDPEKELEPVAAVALQQQVLAVTSSLGIRSFNELVRYSKSNPNALNYGSLGPGSDSHLILEWLRTATGGNWIHVPYNGSPPLLTAMKSGHVHMTLLTSGSLKPHIDSGDLVGLFTRGSERRNPTLPDVPTYAEAGLPPLTATSWAGMFAPTGTPADIILKLNQEISAIIGDSDFRARFMVQPGLEPPAIPLAGMKDFMIKDRAAWEPLVKNSGVQLQ